MKLHDLGTRIVTSHGLKMLNPEDRSDVVKERVDNSIGGSSATPVEYNISILNHVDSTHPGLYWPLPRLRLSHPRYWYCPMSIYQLQEVANHQTSSIRPLLPLRARRRAHRPRKESPHAHDLRSHWRTRTTGRGRQVSTDVDSLQYSQPCRLPTKYAPISNSQIDGSDIHHLLL